MATEVLELVLDTSGAKSQARSFSSTLERAFLSANVSTMLLQRGLRLATEAIRDGWKAAHEFNDATTEMGKAIARTDVAISKMGVAFDRLMGSLVGGAAQGGLPDILNATATALDGVATAVSKFGGVEGLFAALDIAFTGGANASDEFLAQVRGVGQDTERRAAGRRKAEAAKARGRGKAGPRAGVMDFEFIGAGFGEGELGDEWGLTGGDPRFDAIMSGESADDMIGRLDDRNQMIADKERELGEALDGIARDNAARRADVMASFAQAEDEDLDARAQRFAKFGDIMADATMTLVKGLTDMANGQAVAWDKIAKQFLESQGTQLIAMGIKDGLMGISRGLSSYGFDATAYGLITQGAIEVGVGTAMLGGSLLIPGGGGGGGGGGVAARGGGGSYGAGGGGSSMERPATEAQPRYITVNLFGAPDARTGRELMEHLRAAEAAK